MSRREANSVINDHIYGFNLEMADVDRVRNLDVAGLQQRAEALNQQWRNEGYGGSNRDITGVLESGELFKISQWSAEDVYATTEDGRATGPGHYRVCIGEDQRDMEIPQANMPPYQVARRAEFNKYTLYDTTAQPTETLTLDMQWLVGKLGQRPVDYKFFGGRPSFVVDEPNDRMVALAIPAVQKGLAVSKERDEALAWEIERRATLEAGELPRKRRLFGSVALQGTELAAAKQLQLERHRAAARRLSGQR